jgi:hypothetical protein
MRKARYLVTLDDRADMSMADLAVKLRAAGFEIAEQLDAIGIIIGQADDAVIERVRELDGVTSVEQERSIGPV